MGIEEDWLNFCRTDKETVVELKKRKEDIEVPTCGGLVISTKTKIIYLNQPIDLYPLFWNLPMISYDQRQEGVIKKQIKFNFKDKEEVAQFERQYGEVDFFKKMKILNQIDNPNGRVPFKDVRKIDIGICRKDLARIHKKTEKSAFYNCFVFIYRMFVDQKFKEFHIKIFNSGKIEIPGIQDEAHVDLVVKRTMELFASFFPLSLFETHRETILINSNFGCNYYINRDELFVILKNQSVKCSYDPCSYPGIQCKYNLENGEVSFMIFRTGSVLIVGKCEEDELYRIYEFLKQIFAREFYKIYETNYEGLKKKSKKKMKKITIFQEFKETNETKETPEKVI